MPLTTLLLAACARYTLGTRTKPPFSTLAIAPVKNETSAAQMQAPLSQQLTQLLSQENNIHVVGDNSDVTLYIHITGYEHTVAATDPHDTTLGNSFNLRIRALCTLVDNRTGKTLFEKREVRATTVAHAMSGFTAVEYQTMPVLTRALAQKLRDTITSTW
ncbi:MAG: LPS assembly lipoprotein LptE [Puniceicoccales bacterium]|nr:LPS assembly lipoprotein LptE [Puniceicoccales bacterium]